jgi:serine/threonine-protein kinase
MTKAPAHVVLALLIVVGLERAAIAQPDPPPEAKAAAQALFEEARALVKQNDFADACPKFAESQRLDPGIGTLLWLADCYESLGQTATAWVTFRDAAEAAALRRDKRERVARDRVAKLEPWLSRVTIVIGTGAAIPGLEVARDDASVGSAQWGTAVPVDPGVHKIVASAPGHKAWSVTIELAAPAETREVTVPLLDMESPAVTGTSPEAVASRQAGSDSADSIWARRRTWAIVAASAGVLGLGVGTFFSLSAKSAYDSSNSGQPPHCVNNQCDPQGMDDRNTAFSRATASTISFIAGAAALAGGAVLYFTAAGANKTALVVAPNIAGGSARLSVVW